MFDESCHTKPTLVRVVASDYSYVAVQCYVSWKCPSMSRHIRFLLTHISKAVYLTGSTNSNANLIQKHSHIHSEIRFNQGTPWPVKLTHKTNHFTIHESSPWIQSLGKPVVMMCHVKNFSNSTAEPGMDVFSLRTINKPSSLLPGDITVLSIVDGGFGFEECIREREESSLQMVKHCAWQLTSIKGKILVLVPILEWVW